MFSLIHSRQPGASRRRAYSIPLLRILATAALLSALASSAASSRFTPIPSFSSGGSALYSITADVNGDGKPDVIASNTSGKVTLLLGSGHSSLMPPRLIATIAGEGAPSIAVGDFNQDGKPDLAVVSAATTKVLVYLGHGDGTFASPITLPTSAHPTQVAVGDVNNDGHEDLVVGCAGGFNVILGNGNGTFRPATKVPSGDGSNVMLLAVGDVNKDGHLDVFSANALSDGSCCFNYEFLGKGGGTFQPGNSSFDNSSLPQLVAESQVLLADLNGDGKLDLVIMGVQTCDTCEQQVLVGFGDGAGNFQFTGFNAGSQPTSAAVVDLNGDGKPDLAVANVESNSVSVLINKGGGQFLPPVNYATRNLTGLLAFGAGFLSFGDFNGDKRQDLALATGDGVQLLTNLGLGRLSAPFSVETLGLLHSAAAVDLNGDGHVDLAVESNPIQILHDLENVQSLLGNGAGQFTPPSIGGVAEDDVFVGPIAVGDFNHDGKPDLAVLLDGSTGPLILGTGISPPTSGTAVVAGDFNNDGYSDVAQLVGNEVDIYINNKNGTFSGPTAYTVGTNPNSILVWDLNRDGKRDLIVTNNGSDDVSVLYGKGDGTFAPAKAFPAGTHLLSATVGDFNRDGLLDLAVGGDTMEILLGRGKNVFASPISYPSGGAVTFVQQADLRGNNIEDLLIVHGSNTNNLTVLFGKGDGTFAAPTSYPAGASPFALAVADFNGDGAPDVAIVNGGSTALTLLWNQGGDRITLKSSAATAKVGQPITFTAFVQAGIQNVGTPTGTVIFKDGAKSIVVVQLSSVPSSLFPTGKAVFTTSQLSQGTHTITVNYGGNGNFNPGASTPVKETIGP